MISSMSIPVTVSLTEDDVRFLDEVVAPRAGSRSAAVARAIGLLRRQELTRQYEQALDEEDPDEIALWDRSIRDGLEPTPDVPNATG